MDFANEWLNLYKQKLQEFRKFINPSKVDLKDLDVFAIWPYIDITLNKRDNFIFVDRKRLYFYHIRTGYLVHVFSPYVFKFIKKKFGEKTIAKVHRIEPGRRIVYAERVIEGPRGGKLFALGSATHISVDPSTVTSHVLTRKYLTNLRYQLKRKEAVYPNIYVVEKKYPFWKFEKIIQYAVQVPFPKWPIRS